MIHRDRVLILSCLAVVLGLAWTYLVFLSRQMASTEPSAMMAAVGRGMPWTAIDLLLMFGMWAVMMIAMMGASAAPVLLLFGATRTARAVGDVAPTTLAFALGYAAVWLGFSVVAVLAQWVLHETAMLSDAMALSNPQLRGVVLMVVGAYQLTPLKNACLTHCRMPLTFLMSNWRDGREGAFRMGVEHGSYCLGCCWALMGVLFVVGIMNVAWIAAVSVFVLVEKLGPAPRVVGRLAGVAMILVGVWYVRGA